MFDFLTKEVGSIADKLQISAIEKGQEIITLRDGRETVLISLGGINFDLLGADEIAAFSEHRQASLDSLPAGYEAVSFSRRFYEDAPLDVVLGDELEDKIRSRWQESVSGGFVSRHFIQITTPRIKDKLVDAIAGSLSGELATPTSSLLDAADGVMAFLESYFPRLLKGEEINQFYTELLAGQVLPPLTMYDGPCEVLPESEIYFQKKSQCVNYCGGGFRDSVLISIIGTGEKINSLVTAGIYGFDFDVLVTNLISKVDPVKEMADLDKVHNMPGFRADGALSESSLELAAGYASKAVSPIQHTLFVEVFGKSEQIASENAADVVSVLRAAGLRIKIETFNREGLVWGRLPGSSKQLVRSRVLPSSVAARFIPFPSAPKGNDRCTWGDGPICKFRTDGGGVFNYTHHDSTASMALGNVAIFGQSGQGKTTLASHLIACAGHYDGYRTLAFDRLSGQEVFTRMSGGEYYDFGEGTEINPFSIAGNSKNAAFITSFFIMLTGVKSDADINAIAAGVADIMDAKKKGYSAHLSDLDALLGAEGSPIRATLQKWLPHEAYGQYFNGDHDALEFKSKLVTLDMTQLLDIPDVLAPMAHYVLHRLKIEVQAHPAPYAVFVDEANKYLASPVFAPVMRELAAEIRKTHGVLMLAAQSPKAVLGYDIGREMMTNMATFLIFPDPAADWSDYGPDGLGLTRPEYEWVKRPHRRKVLLKRASGPAVVLDVDLAPLGDLSAVYDSSASSVIRLRAEIAAAGDWQSRYLSSR